VDLTAGLRFAYIICDMRLARYRDGGGSLRTGFVVDDTIFAVPGNDGLADLATVLEAGDDRLRRMEEVARSGAGAALDSVRLASPLDRPRAVLCVGRNYAEHAAETQSDIPTEPIIFAKLSSSIVGPHDDIILPAVAPRRIDYEAELAVVIGRAGRDVAEDEAWDYVLGYLVANDVTARDWQMKKPAGQWLLGKSFDTFCPLGPVLVSADEVPNPGSLHVTCRVNGELLQDDTPDHMIFSIPHLIAYLSAVTTLHPGDLLLTGTPAGIGASRVPPRWLQPGDVVETSVETIGTLRNAVRSAAALP
jgi:2-keto-4-pentenoate hydratase/2-oxohepta-3-ene-1,7-dioic acid hydratase in catechol pathway